VTPSVLLLPGASDGPSMTRYARELSHALAALPGERYAISVERPIIGRHVAGLIDHPQTRRIDRAWFRYVSYPRTLRDRTADVFHVLDHAYAHLVRALDSTRTVVTCHDLIPLLAAEGVIAMDLPATVAATFRMRIRQLIRARRVITGSVATQKTLERFTPIDPAQIAVVPLGVGLPFQPIAHARRHRRSAARLSDSAPVVLQVASPVRYKNTPAVLRCFAQLRARAGDAVLVRVGAPLFADECALARTLGVEDAIVFAGAIDDLTLAEWYNASDVLLFPSLWEGFGWPVLEAMACGTPVVASDIPALAELTAGSALLASPADEAALADHIERALTDTSLRTTLREKGLRRASEFTWARAAEATAAVYDEVRQF
jgi:glycosyltransferase involved in cell wall biosynthesis